MSLGQERQVTGGAEGLHALFLLTGSEPRVAHLMSTGPGPSAVWYRSRQSWEKDFLIILATDVLVLLLTGRWR
jgi:hypothetical protein